MKETTPRTLRDSSNVEAEVLGKECQAGPDSFDGALTSCIAPSDARTIEDATEEKRKCKVFGGQDREGVSVESDPDPASPPSGQRCPQTVRRERGQEVARDDQELLRVLGRCIEDSPSLCGMLEVRPENVQHGGGKGPGQVRFEVGAHGVNRYAACDAKTRLKRTECFTRQRSCC